MRALQNIDHTLSLAIEVSESVRQAGEVKVQIHCASLNQTDADIARGDLDLFIRLSRARSFVRTGLEFSGTVVEGSDRFPTGNRVFGYTHLMKGPRSIRTSSVFPKRSSRKCRKT